MDDDFTPPPDITAQEYLDKMVAVYGHRAVVMSLFVGNFNSDREYTITDPQNVARAVYEYLTDRLVDLDVEVSKSGRIWLSVDGVSINKE